MKHWGLGVLLALVAMGCGDEGTTTPGAADADVTGDAAQEVAEADSAGDSTVAPDAQPDAEVPDAADDGEGPDTAVPDVVVPDASEGDADASVPDADASVPDADASTPDAVTPPEGVQTAIGGWTMTPGEEATKCVVVRLDNPTAIKVRAIHTKLSPGSHHLIVYRSNETTEKPTPFNCTPFTSTLSGGSVPLMITQIPEETLQLPDGVVFELGANQMVRLEAHYLNYYPEDIVTNAVVTFEEADPTGQYELADFLFYGNTQFSLKPNQTTTLPWTWVDVPNGSKVFGLTAHTHQYGTNVEISASTGVDDPGTALYPADEAFDWAEPPLVGFDPPVEFPSGLGLRFRCTWDNTTNKTIGFGESANKEMCFLWAYYYPSQGYRVCAKGLFGCPPAD